ncbi:glycerol dehydratase reactivase beta/small subunit family protein [Limosilactobacillus balticus]|uniref:Glycerol dehydratase reactivase beta/small subunit family protein n=1 Tax=Limosilactobacillus balticus TaxID=2759747 RepID=A0ABS8RCS6_9LACO|nr:glycerol dehydratase reactivase beta/small subunit family protein [Limosilactobacillus balticus]MBB1110556.1 glycerol dehydratase reactivase beta/small subunit family protein [Limosilactobacillus balticus]MBB1127959.1 glycerol dehydratase reactivase beta/small subunit family protein [Limosilactobacillus balticus]MCD7136881.1 glycerol dehydratase reactivase beta/small subunit family protein [Limosilactobacillus balticus]MCD7138447.1 glycerol dehydratase reactivase beta/small subunit family pr
MAKKEGSVMNNDDSQRPSIVVGLKNGTTIPDSAKPLFYGIEEEQIPVSVRKINIDGAIERAYQSALASRLSVGIAFEGDHFIVHYKNLKEEHPLFDMTVDDRKQLRILGANAARLVKGIPFKEIANR